MKWYKVELKRYTQVKYKKVKIVIKYSTWVSQR